MQNLKKLDLGSGEVPYKDFIGIDYGHESERVIKSDVLSFLKKVESNSVSNIYSKHYFEHINPDDLPVILKEIDRVLENDGMMEIIVPHYSNPFFYSDPTHRIFYGVHSFSYICEKSCMKRGVPKYIAIKGWALEAVKVRFVSMLSWRIFGYRIPTMANVLNRAINPSYRFIELFERYLCSIFSIYEVRFLIIKRKG